MFSIISYDYHDIKAGEGMDLLEALGNWQSALISIVGAGGKTSLMLSLAKEFQAMEGTLLLTATTRMFLNQVAGFNPVYEAGYELGKGRVSKALAGHRCAAWFSHRQGDKVVGIPPEWISKLYSEQIVKYILVEADGAKQKLLKAPGRGEPVVPELTTHTLGVLNLQALGKPLGQENVHRLEFALPLLQKRAGERIEPRDLAILAGSCNGIFKGSRGERILVISGGSTGEKAGWQSMLNLLPGYNEAGIKHCLLTEGSGSQVKALEARAL